MGNETAHILIVDDDPDLLAVIGDVLGGKGFKPVKAQTGGAALAQLAERGFDVALIDLRLGDMSGLDVLSAVKARSPETECILLTGHATQDSAIKAIQLDAFGYFQKPVEMEQLLLAVQRAVEKHQSARALRESEARYRAVIHSATDAIVSADSAGKIVGWNPGAGRIFGYTESEALNQPLDLLMPARHHAGHLAGMARVNAEGEKHLIGKTVEVEGRRKDGGEFPLEISLSEWQVADGRFYTALIRDITERKRIEHQALERTKELRAFYKLAEISGREGISLDELYREFTDILPESWQYVESAFARIVMGNREYRTENFTESALTQSAPIKVNGAAVGLVEVGYLKEHPEEDEGPFLKEERQLIDAIAERIGQITERKQAENALARTNLRLQSLRLIDHALLGASVEGSSADIEALRHLAALVPCGRINIIALDEITDSAKFTARATGKELSVSRVNEPVALGDLRLNEMQESEITVAKLEAEKINPLEKKLYDMGGRSLVKAPLVVQGRLIGILALSSENPDFFTGEHLEIIKDVSAQLALSLHHENLLNEIRRHAEQLEKRVQERTAEIEATRQRLELAVNVGEIGVWELNLKDNQVVWDRHMHLIHGTNPADFDNSVDTWWRMIHPHDVKQSQKQFQEAVQLTGLFTDEHRILCADGSLRHVMANAVVLYDAEHIPERMIGVNVDVTERRQVEETMRRANLEMERALRIKDEFLANMSHELRTPLNAIMGISESLLEQTAGELNEKQRRYISTVNESGAHLLSLINDILDLSKIEAGRMELTITDVSVKSLFESGFRMVKEMAQKKKVAVLFEADERIQTLRGDARRLLQMLVNLLSNAVKFTPAGGTAGVRVAAHPSDLNEIHFTVWDTGVGIAEEDLPRLFQPFVQLDSSLARASSGTGLGLMLVMQMARMHGGNISVQSKPGEGSRFTVSLPWSQAEQDSALGKRKEETRQTQPLKTSHAGNILLIEDTESVVMLLGDYLQARGHRLWVACDGLSGLGMAKAERPDLILLDIQMPGMDGFEVVKKLHEDESLKDIPVIALTALAMPGDRERCLAAGMTDYISKPVRLKELAKLLEGYLEK